MGRERQDQAALEARVRRQEARLEELAEALQRGERLKSEFLASVSHELRTPLNVVLGFASLIYDEAFGPLNSQQQEATSKVLESAERLAQLINDLLDAARLERGTLPLRFAAVDVGEVAREMLEELRPLAASKGLIVEVDMPARMAEVWGDEDRLRQVFGHLLDNAVKFTPEGGRIGIRGCADGGDGTIAIEVWDTGIGIPAEAIHRLFTRFFQVDGSNTRLHGGTGLGLALVKELVERQGGEVVVESEIGHGSTFRVVLPTAAMSQAAQAARGG